MPPKQSRPKRKKEGKKQDILNLSDSDDDDDDDKKDGKMIIEDEDFMKQLKSNQQQQLEIQEAAEKKKKKQPSRSEKQQMITSKLEETVQEQSQANYEGVGQLGLKKDSNQNSANGNKNADRSYVIENIEDDNLVNQSRSVQQQGLMQSVDKSNNLLSAAPKKKGKVTSSKKVRQLGDNEVKDPNISHDISVIALEPDNMDKKPDQKLNKLDPNQSQILQGQPILEEDEHNHRMKEVDDDDGLIEKIDVYDDFEQYQMLAQGDGLNTISEFCQSIAKFLNKTGKKIQEKIKKADEKLLSKGYNKFKLKSGFFFVFFLFIIVMAVYLGLTAKAKTITQPSGYSEMKKYIANNLVGGAIIFTFYGIIFLHLNNYVAYIVLFLFQAVPSMFVFLYYAYGYYVNQRSGEEFPMRYYYQSLLSFAIYFFWLATYLIQHDIKTYFSFSARNFFLSIWCILFAAMIIGYSIYSAITTFDINYGWGYRLINVIAPPYIILICLAWVYMHFRYFVPMLSNLTGVESFVSPTNNAQDSKQPSQSQSNLKDPNGISQQVVSIRRQSVLKKPDMDQASSRTNPNDITALPEERISPFQKNVHLYIVIFSSGVMGGVMLTMTILSIIHITDALEEADQLGEFRNPKSVYLSFFFSMIIPLYTLLGTGVLWSKISYKTKLNLIPILGAMIPIIFSVPFSKIIDQFKEVRPFKNYIMAGPSAVVIYWLTLIWLKVSNWKLTMLMNSYICIFFLAPFLYILPLRNIDAYDKDDPIAEVFYIVLIVLGVGLIVSIVFLEMLVNVFRTWKNHTTRHTRSNQNQEQDEFTKLERFELADIFKYDLEDFGLWGNAIGYILTFSILIFMYFNAPSWITSSQSGALIGLQISVIYLFFVSFIIIITKIIPDKPRQDKQFTEKIAMFCGKHQKFLIQDRQKKIKRFILRFGFLESPVICGVLIAILKDNEEMRINFLVALLGNILVTLIFWVFFKVKEKFEDFSQTAVPTVITFTWIFVYLPFIGIIPTAMMYLSIDREQYVVYERMVIACLVLLAMMGLSLTIVVFHLFFKRRENEKKFKFISCRVIKKMAKQHVKTDFYMMNLIYQGFVQNGHEYLRRSLLETKKPVYCGPISKFDPNMAFSKMLIDFETWDKLSKQKQPENEIILKLSKYFFTYYCCLGDNSQLNQEIDEFDGLDPDTALMRAQDKVNEMDLGEMFDNEDATEDDPDAWWKKYHVKLKLRKPDPRIIEALRRYDLAQNLQISKQWQTQFISNVFRIFAYGSKNKHSAKPWIDYSLFKQLLILSGLEGTREFQDQIIDKLYSKFTSYEKVANSLPITEDRFTQILGKLGQIKYPFDIQEDSLGKIVKFWLFPFLLWHVPAMHGFYPHEWDYVLYLLGEQGKDDLKKIVMIKDIYFRRDLEKELGILPLDAQNLNPDLDQNKLHEQWNCERIMRSIREWCSEFRENIKYYLKSHMLLEKEMKNYSLDQIEMEVKLINETLLKTKPIFNKRRREFKHPDSPAWPQLVDVLVDEVRIQERAWIKLKEDEFKNMRVRCNVTNTFAVIFKILEIYALGTLAFRNDIDWGFTPTAQIVINFINTFLPNEEIPLENSKFALFFWISWISGVVLVIISYRSVLRIRNQTLGQCETKGRFIRFWQPELIYNQLLNLIGMVLSFFMIKTFMDTFACDYAVVPESLYIDPNFLCYTGDHNSFVIVAVICIIVFYPTLVLLYSNIQYQNKTLDLKYDPTYMVLSGCLKIMIAGASSFWGYSDSRIYMLAFCAVFLFGFGILTRKMKPCLVKRVNPLQMGGYLLAGWCHVSSIVTYYTEPYFGGICLGVGFFIIILISLGYFKILYDRQRDAKRRGRLNSSGDNLSDEDSGDEDAKLKGQEESFEFKVWRALNDYKQRKELAKEWINEKQLRDILPLENDNQDDLIEKQYLENKQLISNK